MNVDCRADEHCFFEFKGRGSNRTLIFNTKDGTISIERLTYEQLADLRKDVNNLFDPRADD